MNYLFPACYWILLSNSHKSWCILATSCCVRSILRVSNFWQLLCLGYWVIINQLASNSKQWWHSFFLISFRSSTSWLVHNVSRNFRRAQRSFGRCATMSLFSFRCLKIIILKSFFTSQCRFSLSYKTMISCLKKVRRFKLTILLNSICRNLNKMAEERKSSIKLYHSCI